MITRRAPWDHERRRRTIRKPVDRNLCAICGNDAVDTPAGVHCLTCTSAEFVKVPEFLVDTVRCGLWMAQHEKALYIAGLMPDIGGAIELNWKGEMQ